MFISEVVGHLVFLGFFVAVLYAGAIFSSRWRHRSFDLQEKTRQQRDSLALMNKQLTEMKIKIVQAEKMASLGTLSAGLLHEMNIPVNYSKNV